MAKKPLNADQTIAYIKYSHISITQVCKNMLNLLASSKESWNYNYHSVCRETELSCTMHQYYSHTHLPHQDI